MSISNESNQQSSKQSDAVNQQGNSDQFDYSLFNPKGISVELFDKGEGFSIIPHRMLEWIVKVCSTKVELRVMLCLVRNSLGSQSSIVKASQTFVGNWTDLLEPNARRALKALVDSGLIVQLHRGTNKHDWGVYEIPFIKAYLEQLVKKQRANTPPTSEIKSIPNPASPSSNQSENSDQNDLSAPIKSIPKKERYISNKENTLSLNKNAELPESLSNYFSSIKAYKLREKEWKHFLGLKKAYPVLTIAKCLDSLLGFGLPGNGEKSYCPMGFLATGIDQVLASTEAREKEEAAAQAQKLAQIEAEEKANTKKNQDDADWEAKVLAFEQAFPNQADQWEYISEFQKQNPMFKSNPDALRSLAISCFSAERGLEVSHG